MAEAFALFFVLMKLDIPTLIKVCNSKSCTPSRLFLLYVVILFNISAVQYICMYYKR